MTNTLLAFVLTIFGKCRFCRNRGYVLYQMDAPNEPDYSFINGTLFIQQPAYLCNNCKVGRDLQNRLCP